MFKVWCKDGVNVLVGMTNTAYSGLAPGHFIIATGGYSDVVRLQELHQESLLWLKGGYCSVRPPY